MSSVALEFCLMVSLVDTDYRILTETARPTVAPDFDLVLGCSHGLYLLRKFWLTDMTLKYVSGNHGKSWSKSLNAKERCFNVSFLI